MTLQEMYDDIYKVQFPSRDRMEARLVKTIADLEKRLKKLEGKQGK